MVVEEIEGVVNEVPVPKLVPPLAALYQLMVPALALAPKVTVPAPHRSPGVVVRIVGIVLTEAVTGVLEVDVHDPLVAST